jgi:histidinol-phosphatase
MTNIQNPFVEVALEAARAGEEVIRHYYDKNVQVTMKEDYTPVTVADVETEQKIHQIISAAYPHHGFYGEETGMTNVDADYVWLIDPIDGTKSFVRQYPFFSTQIALMHRGELIVGVSNGVMFNECAWASRGEGAFINGQAIKVSDIEELREMRLYLPVISPAWQVMQIAGAGWVILRSRSIEREVMVIFTITTYWRQERSK